MTLEPPEVQLVQLPLVTLAALGNGDLATAQLASPVPLSPYLVSAECRGTWLYRSKQVAAAPSDATWVTRAAVDLGRQEAVGRAGFHGPPDQNGMVEVGYSIDPQYRRRGYARAALQVLLDRAAAEPAVRTVRATISPGNVASRGLVLQYGFVEVGEQMDPEDGLEIIFEVAAGQAEPSGSDRGQPWT